MALAAYPVLNRFRRRVDPRRYNGASLLGLRGLVLKSHGSADGLAFECALRRGYEEARHRVLERTDAPPCSPSSRSSSRCTAAAGGE